MNAKDKAPSPEQRVVLGEVLPGLLDGLPPEDQQAIVEVVGKPVLLNEYTDQETVELQFTDGNGAIHFVYVSRSFIRHSADPASLAAMSHSEALSRPTFGD